MAAVPEPAPAPESPLEAGSEFLRQMFAPFMPGIGAEPGAPTTSAPWSDAVRQMQAMWQSFQIERADDPADAPNPLALFGDPARWAGAMEGWYKAMPLSSPETQKQLWSDGLALWQGVLGGFGPAAKPGADGQAPALPFSDRRFADPKWREQPLFALVHQSYLMLAQQLTAMAEGLQGIEPAKKDQLKFATRTLVEALSPANFPLTNPVVLERTIATKGQNLVKGMEHLMADMRRGQLTHVDPEAFVLGENIAATPGKVVHETPMLQLIQYTPTTPDVLATPLVIFPPFINRYYILDLNPAKSFIKWAVDHGITVFIASWRSADASMADVVWDDYVAAQIDAMEVARDRLGVTAVHAIGYCVAGTTLAATLALLTRRGKADLVKSATFFTAQVDFAKAGELKVFIDGQQLQAISQIAKGGFLDGRYTAATFNLLRGTDLIWNYVVNNYLLGEDYPAFDMLHWNGDTTNLPAKWHQSYLRDLYRDNKLVIPDELSIDGTPLDIRLIETPAFIQAGREDHIAPAESVWEITRYLQGPHEFVLAGSGHIAGVVNPPAAGKYQYWTNQDAVASFADFVAGAHETKGSWWPYWLAWLERQDNARVPATGKRVPGAKGDRVIEDAPGRYVKMR